MEILFFLQPIDLASISYNVYHKENMLYPSAIQTSFPAQKMHVVGMIEIINVIVTPRVKLESFGYSRR